MLSFQGVADEYNRLYATYSERDPTKALDAFPDGEECMFMASPALEFLANQPLDNDFSNIELMRSRPGDPIAPEPFWTWFELKVAGEMTETDFASTMVFQPEDTLRVDPVPTNAESQDVPADGPDEEDEYSIGLSLLASGGEPEEEDASESSDNDSNSSQASNDNDSDAEVATPNHSLDDEVMGADWSGLTDVQEALFGDHADLDPVAIYNALTSLPGTDLELFGFRAGHAPVNGACPGCGRAIEDVVDMRVAESKGRNKLNYFRRHWNPHVRDCLSASVVEKCQNDFPNKYPPVVPVHPVTGKTIISTKKLSKKATATAAWVSTSSRNLLRHSSRKGGVPCALCDDFIVHGYGALKGHLAAEHAIFLPSPAERTNAQLLDILNNWDWSVAENIIRLPT